MSDGRDYSRVRKVISRNINCLHGCDGAERGRSNAVLNFTHFGSKACLISAFRRNVPQERRSLHAGQNKTIHVIDEKENIFFLVAEIFRNTHSRECHTETRSGGLVHLAENHRGFLRKLRPVKFHIQFMPLPDALPHSGKYRDSFVSRNEVVNELHNKNSFPDARPSEKSDFSSFHERRKEVDNFETGFKNAVGRFLINRSGRLVMNWVGGSSQRCWNWAFFVLRLACNVNKPP